MAFGGFFHITENSERKLARMKRWRSIGWLKFTAGYTVLASLALAVPLTSVFGTFIGYSYFARLTYLMFGFMLVNLFGSQAVWLSLPVGIELIEEHDFAKKNVYREGFALLFTAMIVGMASTLVPLLLGRQAAVPDLMIVASSLVVGAWGLGKAMRYWREKEGWAERSMGSRFVRSYILLVLYLGFAALICVRVYACYGDAAWALPVRQVIQ